MRLENLFPANLNKSLGLMLQTISKKSGLTMPKFLLTNHHLPVSDVATAVGYQDGRYFSKVFKKAVGITPMKYKRSFKSDTTVIIH
ncbi:helix-turn-helix domain-containing protein [Mesobacillus foraminis]|uniref:helix-turn-helix domain-containing protein n=1 Tax=Mesobacillus foraminis TaxID=279826 RepID=UPI0027D7A5C0|nr:helix-turn-helix domain-containing protein [Mesobacillus foraminis]